MESAQLSEHRLARRQREPFGRWAVRRRLAFGLLIRKLKSPGRAADCERLTRRNLALHNEAARAHYLEGPDIDAMLRSAWIGGYDYLLIQAPGSYIVDKPGFSEALEDEMETGFFVLGHVLDRGPDYYTLHHQCLLVNLGLWHDIGAPAFGAEGATPRELHRPRRSEENFHDGHTPLWIAPSGESASYPRQQPAWSFIHAGLEAGVRIAPFTRRIRRKKAYLYPEHDGDYFQRLGDHRRRALGWSEGAWVANTERLAPIEATAFPGPVESIISVAAGLNCYLLLARLGHRPDTAVHYVDSSRATLAFKRWLLANWDGRDYAGAVAAWRAAEPGHGIQRGISEAEIAAVLAGTEDDFARRWQEFRRLPHHFHELDFLTSDQDRIAGLIAPGSTGTLLWFSNVFHSYYSHAILSEEENASLYRGWIERLRRRNPATFVIGRDQHHNPVAGRVGALGFGAGTDLPVNLCYPPEILDWFAAEGEQLRKLGRR